MLLNTRQNVSDGSESFGASPYSKSPIGDTPLRFRIATLHHYTRACILALVCACSAMQISAQALSSKSLQWQTLGNLREGRSYFEAQPISCCEALVAGGYTNGTAPANGIPTRTCEIINVEERTISAADPMTVAHAETVSLLTADSNIVVLSGMSDNGKLTPLCEIYDRRTRSWRVLGTLLTARRQHTALFVNADEILVVSGRGENLLLTPSCEIFNIRTGVSRAVANFPAPFCIGNSGRSASGEILVMGGAGYGFGYARSGTVYKFNLALETWQPVSILPEKVSASHLFTLSNGKLALFYGQTDEDQRLGWLASNRIYVETNGVFRAVAASPTKRYWASVSAWNSDSLLVIGGFEDASFTPNESFVPRALAVTEWFNARTGTLSPGPMLNVRRVYAKSLSFSGYAKPKANATNTNLCSNNATSRLITISGFDSWTSATPSVEILERSDNTNADQPPTIVAFPQPASERITIIVPVNSGIEREILCQYHLFNTRGQTIQQGTTALQSFMQSFQGTAAGYAGQLDVAHLASGYYVLTLAGTGVCGSVTVLVQH